MGNRGGQQYQRLINSVLKSSESKEIYKDKERVQIRMASLEGLSADNNRSSVHENKRMRVQQKKYAAEDDENGNNNDSFRSNSSPEKIRQMLAEKDEFILNLEKKLNDVMEELAVMRGEQSKWQRKYQKQEEFIAKCQDIIKTYETKFQSDSPTRHRSNQGSSPLQAGALSSLNRQYYQKVNSPVSHTPKKIIINERRDPQPQVKQYINSGYDPQEEAQGYAQSEKKHSKQAEPRKYIASSEELRFYSDQKVVKQERQQYHNPSGFEDNYSQVHSRKQQLHMNQSKQYQQQPSEQLYQGNIFSNRKSNDIHSRLLSTPNVSLIKIPFSKLQKISSKEIKHRLHLIPEGSIGLN